MAKKKSNVVLIHTVICDDIRREDTGKLLLIGVYPDSIQMNVIPAQIALALWLQFEMTLSEKLNLEFEFKGDALEKPVTLPITMDNPKFTNTAEIVPLMLRVALGIKKPGNISIAYRTQGEKAWESAYELRVRSNKLNS